MMRRLPEGSRGMRSTRSTSTFTPRTEEALELGAELFFERPIEVGCRDHLEPHAIGRPLHGLVLDDVGDDAGHERQELAEDHAIDLPPLRGAQHLAVAALQAGCLRLQRGGRRAGLEA